MLSRSADGLYFEGGYLSLLSGLAITGLNPRPRAIIALYPITNPLGEFFTTSQHPVSYNRGVEILTSDMAEHIDPNSAVVSETQGAYTGPLTAQSRVHLYTYMVRSSFSLIFASSSFICFDRSLMVCYRFKKPIWPACCSRTHPKRTFKIILSPSKSRKTSHRSVHHPPVRPRQRLADSVPTYRPSCYTAISTTKSESVKLAK